MDTIKLPKTPLWSSVADVTRRAPSTTLTHGLQV